MRANALRIQPEVAGPGIGGGYRRQDSQVNLKAPRPPEFWGDSSVEVPTDFVAFMSEERGIAPGDAFDLLCRLVAEYRTPVRREIDVLKLSA